MRWNLAIEKDPAMKEMMKLVKILQQLLSNIINLFKDIKKNKNMRRQIENMKNN